MHIEAVDFFYLAMPEVTDEADGSQDARSLRGDIRVYDPQGMEHARNFLTGVEFCDSALDACRGADCMVLATEWRQFRSLDALVFQSRLLGILYLGLAAASYILLTRA